MGGQERRDPQPIRWALGEAAPSPPFRGKRKLGDMSWAGEGWMATLFNRLGDRIRLEAKRVILNGRVLDEPYKRNADLRFESFRDWFPHSSPLALPDRAMDMLTRVEKGELIVPPGQYFALGDNRDFSLDSRYWGFVPRENIAGRPLLIWWSYDAQHDLRNWNLPHLVDLAQHFVTRSRWNRTLRLIR